MYFNYSYNLLQITGNHYVGPDTLPVSSSDNLMFHIKSTSTSVLRHVSLIPFMTKTIVISDHNRDLHLTKKKYFPWIEFLTLTCFSTTF